MMMVQPKIGSMPRRVLAFSTCVTLHSLHGLSMSFGWIIAALSNNL